MIYLAIRELKTLRPSATVRVLVLTGSLWVAASQCFAAVNPEKSASYFEDALQLFHKGEFEASVIQLKNAVQENPDNIAARVLLGRAYLTTGEPEAAGKELLTAREYGADEALIAVPLADSYILQRKFEQLLQEIFGAGHSPEGETEISIRRGHAHLELTELDQAEQAFAHVLADRPAEVRATLGLASVSFQRGELGLARSFLDTAEGQQPNHPGLWLLRGEISRLEGQIEAALAHYDRALEASPDHIEALKASATVLLGLGRHAAARKDIELIRELVPLDPTAAYLHALVLAQTNEMEDARSALETVATLIDAMDPEVLDSHGPSLLLAGVVNISRGTNERAFPYLVRYVARYPFHPASRKYLGHLLIQRGEYTRAVEVLEPAVQMVPTNSTILTLLASAYLENGDHAKAAPLFERALTHAPGALGTLLQLGRTRLASGDHHLAIGSFETLLKLEPGMMKAGFAAGNFVSRGR